MSVFSLYFQLGMTHILDWNGYDHILFIIALCAIYSLSDWRKILVLVTAFTIGHSITLALVTLDIITINASLIEFIIPITIFVTALSNIISAHRPVQISRISLNYFYALFFGLIHGMGFSNYLKSIMGKSSSMVTELFAFNIGLEIGQIVIVLGYLFLTFMIVGILKTKRKTWSLITSIIVLGVSLHLIYESTF